MDSLVLDVGQESRTELATATAGGAGRRTRGVEIAATDLWQTVKGGKQVLQGVSLTVKACELVAVVGGSGAGKTTLLEAIAGVRPAERGEVRFDGVDLYANLERSAGCSATSRRTTSSTPTCRSSARCATRPRCGCPAAHPRPRSTRRSTGARRARPVAPRRRPGRRADGGQRKRASIAVELLDRARASSSSTSRRRASIRRAPASCCALLRGLADAGATVVFTTHSVQDLAHVRPRRRSWRAAGHSRSSATVDRGARVLRRRARRGDLRAARLGRDARGVVEAVREPSPQRRPRRDRGRAGRAGWPRRHRLCARMGGADPTDAARRSSATA